MSTAPKAKAGASQKKTFEHREDTGTLFYDEPGAPTLRGTVKHGKAVDVTAEPAVDKNQRDYTKISGKDVSGALYPNERKENERHPDFTGPIEINGDHMRVSAWKKVTQNGKNAGSEFLSLAFSFKRENAEAA